jgi:hypothetical protein
MYKFIVFATTLSFVLVGSIASQAQTAGGTTPSSPTAPSACSDSGISDSDKAAAKSAGAAAGDKAKQDYMTAHADEITRMDASGKATATATATTVGNQAAAQKTQDELATKPRVVCGLLALPGKFELTGKEDVVAGGSANIFIGYNPNHTWTWLPINIIPVFYAGFTSNFTSQNTGAKGATQQTNNWGFSYGVGLDLDLGKTSDTSTSDVFAGIIVGADHVASSARYQYNDKPYLSLVLGAAF